MNGRRILVGAGALLLLVATGVVFAVFDGRSHSASDTLRPFLITMAPVWLVAVAASRRVLRTSR